MVDGAVPRDRTHQQASGIPIPGSRDGSSREGQDWGAGIAKDLAICGWVWTAH